ncbi:hypothetical protein Bbelb_335770 [Branchiostoma belcheri]|nr:hypothetical protein Bbelb_335770 [Branchiostoma belcheri]
MGSLPDPFVEGGTPAKSSQIHTLDLTRNTARRTRNRPAVLLGQNTVPIYTNRAPREHVRIDYCPRMVDRVTLPCSTPGSLCGVVGQKFNNTHRHNRRPISSSVFQLGGKPPERTSGCWEEGRKVSCSEWALLASCGETKKAGGGGALALCRTHRRGIVMGSKAAGQDGRTSLSPVKLATLVLASSVVIVRYPQPYQQAPCHACPHTAAPVSFSAGCRANRPYGPPSMNGPDFHNQRVAGRSIDTSASANLQETTVANSATTGQPAMTKRIGSDMHLHLTAMLGHGGASSKPHTLPRATEADGQARPRQEPVRKG